MDSPLRNIDVVQVSAAVIKGMGGYTGFLTAQTFNFALNTLDTQLFSQMAINDLDEMIQELADLYNNPPFDGFSKLRALTEFVMKKIQVVSQRWDELRAQLSSAMNDHLHSLHVQNNLTRSSLVKQDQGCDSFFQEWTLDGYAFFQSLRNQTHLEMPCSLCSCRFGEKKRTRL